MVTKNTKVGAGHPQNVLVNLTKSDFVNLTKSDVSAEKSDDDLAFYGFSERIRRAEVLKGTIETAKYHVLRLTSAVSKSSCVPAQCVGSLLILEV